MFPIFMWIKEYNGLKDFKINLDSNYSIKFKTNINEIKWNEELKILNLEIKKLEHKISSDFYGDNIDSINLILGKNGTGKSSILDVLSIVNIHEKQIEHMIIYKTEDKGKYVLEGYYSMREDENYFSLLKNKPKYPIRSDYSLLIDSNNNFIRFLNFNFKDDISLPNSLIGKFKENSKKRSEQEKGIDQYYPTNRDLRIARLNLNFEEDYYSNLYSYIFSLKENYSENYGNVDMYLEVDDRFKYTSDGIEKMLIGIGEKKEKLVLYDLNDKDPALKEEILKNYCNGLYLYNFEKNIVKIKFKEDFNRINEEEMKKYKKIEIKESLKLLLNDCDSMDTRDDYIYDSLVSFINIVDNLEVINDSLNSDSSINNGEYDFFQIEKQEYNYKFSMKFKFGFKEYKEKITEYLKIYDNDFFKETYGELGNTFKVKLSNGFSDGEKSLLGLFSSLYKVIEVEGRERKYITLMFDEVENFLHPEWCRTLMNKMITELGKKYPNKVFKLIFASHSPFLLSDVLSENCTFLEKKENETKIKDVKIKSFGANIHELLKEGMFMESTFGEFSRNKIKKIVAKLQDKENKLGKNETEEMNFVINSIGEPLVANKLRNMLNKKNDGDNNNEVERYKNRIKELELKLLNKNIEDKPQPVKI